MNIIVPIKQVPDTGLNLRISNGKIDEQTLKWVLSPYDEFALEEALKLKQEFEGKLFVITLGPPRAKEALLTALALGADEAFHLVSESLPQNPLIIAQTLKEHISKIPNIALVFCGKLATDSNNFAVPQMLASLLDFPFITNINSLKYEKEKGVFQVKRECGAGKEEILQAQCPLVLSADKGLNEPRYPSLPGIMKAKKKAFTSLNVNIEEDLSDIKLINLSSPKKKRAPIMITGTEEEQVAELLKVLKDKEKLL